IRVFHVTGVQTCALPIFPAFEQVMKQIHLESLKIVLQRLDDRERRILEMRYGLNGNEPATLDEVGREFNVTRERIRQIETRAIEKLRKGDLDDPKSLQLELAARTAS